jgi:hypothetical protein
MGGLFGIGFQLAGAKEGLMAVRKEGANGTLQYDPEEMRFPDESVINNVKDVSVNTSGVRNAGWDLSLGQSFGPTEIANESQWLIWLYDNEYTQLFSYTDTYDVVYVQFDSE